MLQLRGWWCYTDSSSDERVPVLFYLCALWVGVTVHRGQKSYTAIKKKKKKKTTNPNVSFHAAEVLRLRSHFKPGRAARAARLDKCMLVGSTGLSLPNLILFFLADAVSSLIIHQRHNWEVPDTTTYIPPSRKVVGSRLTNYIKKDASPKCLLITGNDLFFFSSLNSTSSMMVASASLITPG